MSRVILWKSSIKSRPLVVYVKSKVNLTKDWKKQWGKCRVPWSRLPASWPVSKLRFIHIIVKMKNSAIAACGLIRRRNPFDVTILTVPISNITFTALIYIIRIAQQFWKWGTDIEKLPSAEVSDLEREGQVKTNWWFPGSCIRGRSLVDHNRRCFCTFYEPNTNETWLPVLCLTDPNGK